MTPRPWAAFAAAIALACAPLAAMAQTVIAPNNAGVPMQAAAYGAKGAAAVAVDTSHGLPVNCVTGCSAGSSTNTSGTQGAITAADVATTSTAGQAGVNAVTGAPTASSFVTYAIASAASGGTLTISGTFVATSQIEVSYDGGAHYTASSALLRGTSTVTSAITGAGAFSVDLNGATHLRVRSTAYTSGTVTVDFTYSAAPGLTKVLNPISVVDTTATKIDPMPKTGGKVGGYSFFLPTTPTIQNAAYASGNCMGGFQAVTVSATTGATGTLHSVTVASKGGATTALQVYAFSSNPSASTCTDKSTFTINAADVSKLITSFTVTPAARTGTTVTYGEAVALGRTFATSGNGNLYFAIVSGGTFTPASVSDLVLSAGGFVDAP